MRSLEPWSKIEAIRAEPKATLPRFQSYAIERGALVFSLFSKADTSSLAPGTHEIAQFHSSDDEDDSQHAQPEAPGDTISVSRQRPERKTWDPASKSNSSQNAALCQFDLFQARLTCQGSYPIKCVPYRPRCQIWLITG